MNRTRMLVVVGIFILAGIVATAPSARAGGFQVPSHAAPAAAQADAFAAQADDPSAVFYNPAGITQLRGTQVMGGLYSVFPDFQFNGAAGHAESTEAAYVPHFYAVTDLASDRWRLGIAVNSVFGLREDFGDPNPLQVQVTHTDLSVVNFAPTLAYRINEHLSVAAGLDVYYGDIELNNKLPLAPGFLGNFQFQGTDTGLGGTAGALWTINPKHSIGVVYRSPFQMQFDGQTQIDRPGLPTVGPSSAKTTVDFPQTVVVGYAWRATRDLTLETDVQWTNWDTVNQVSLQTSDPRFRGLPVLRLDYHDSFIYRLGAQYRLDEHWTLRAGYSFNQSATPSETFTPTVVDLDSHVFTAGFGYSQPSWAVDLAYRYIVGIQREINNSVNSPPGTYSDHTQTVMVSFTYRF